MCELYEEAAAGRIVLSRFKSAALQSVYVHLNSIFTSRSKEGSYLYGSKTQRFSQVKNFFNKLHFSRIGVLGVGGDRVG